MAGGFANREIARALHLADGTIKNHVSSILLKLGARDRTRAVLLGLELGIFRGGPGAPHDNRGGRDQGLPARQPLSSERLN